MAGDPGGNRTRGHLIKSQVLYQLSYRISRAFYFIRYTLSLQEPRPTVKRFLVTTLAIGI